MSTTSKIRATHLERTAIIYVRQSSPAQVRDNPESWARQYALVEEAAQLGWPASKIEVIDADLGISGRSAERRSGFREVVSRVCLGEVGAIFGLEVSRLARSNADFARLLELARLTDTLVIDTDGMYDLREFNDRLLLGLKGAMSEAELHILAGRLHGAKRAAAERGELRFALPVGYVRDAEGATIIDPDQEVTAAVADVFAAFQATGSAYGVVGAFTSRRFPRRAYGGVWAGELRWGRLTHSRVRGILANPAYAGAYVFGRYRSRQIVSADGSVRDTTREQPRSEWPVVILDHHPGYISWDQYLANQQRLAANSTRSGARPPREGVALYQGIVHCGSCGRSMSTNYQANGRPFYDCADSRGDHVQTKACRSLVASSVDQVVANRLLQMLSPGEVALALAAADEVTQRRQRSTRASELALERAQYDADRAERTLLACEPENRLVGRSLESRWEAKLAAVAEAEAALVATRAAVPALPPRAELEALASDLPTLWNASTTSAKDRKRLLRTLVADVTVTSQVAGNDVCVGIRWRSGASEQIVTRRPPRQYEAVRTPSEATAFIVQRGPLLTNQDLVAELNTAGFKTGMGRPFDVDAVQWVRHIRRVPTPSPFQVGELSVDEVAVRLSINAGAIYQWIECGQLAARRTSTGRLCVAYTPEVEAACRKRVENSCHMKPTSQKLLGAGAV